MTIGDCTSPTSSKTAPVPAREEADEAPPRRDSRAFPTLNASAHARATLQPLNDLSDNMKPSSSSKSNIRLSIGDPTVDGNLRTPAAVTQALMDVVSSCDFNGYPNTIGYDKTRDVVAEYCAGFCQTKNRKQQLRGENVIMTSGVSQGIVLALSALCNPGDNILMCAPSFPHYKSVCDGYGIDCRYYSLNPAKHWESDLQEAATLVDARTKAFIMINPSNPCGSNFCRAHVKDIISFCERHQLPLISDEIYAEMVFHGAIFTSVADFDTSVPRLVLGGTAKYQACPGWRVGWTLLVDPLHAAEEWLDGMVRLAQLISGPNSVCQEAIARTLLDCPRDHTEEMVVQLEAGAACYNRLLDHDLGISFDAPKASMFIMLKINYDYFSDINSDMEFYEKLLDEENVQVLPGEIFGVSGFIRSTVSRPPAIINEAIDRMIEFCERHKK